NTKTDWIFLEGTPHIAKLLISDMDPTMIEQECIDEIGKTIGKGEQIALITKQTMEGKLPFEEALKKRVALLQGVAVSTLEEIIANRITPMAGAKELISTMRQKGTLCVLVSGGFSFFTKHIAEHLSFDHHHANQLEIKQGHLTGNLTPPLLGSQSKLDYLEHYRKQLTIDYADILALGDGANDLAMLQKAGLGIAYHPKPILAEAIEKKIFHSPLTAALYIQGIGKE
ncbi:MAG: phosphoserine phosphatase SerB, partial [Parvibaculales bacterium]